MSSFGMYLRFISFYQIKKQEAGSRKVRSKNKRFTFVMYVLDLELKQWDGPLVFPCIHPYPVLRTYLVRTYLVFSIFVDFDS